MPNTENDPAESGQTANLNPEVEKQPAQEVKATVAQAQPKSGNKKVLIIIGIIIGALILLCGLCSVIGALTNPSTPSTNNNAQTSNTPIVTTAVSEGTTVATQSPSPATQSPTPTVKNEPSIGDIVEVYPFQYKVLSAKDLGKTLTSSNQFIGSKTTSGKWISVRFEVTNTSSTAEYLTDPEIEDNNGTKFEESSDAIYYIKDDEYPVIEKINPGITKTYTLIYDIPANSSGLKFLVGDALFTSGKTINLGL